MGRHCGRVERVVKRESVIFVGYRAGSAVDVPKEGGRLKWEGLNWCLVSTSTTERGKMGMMPRCGKVVSV